MGQVHIDLITPYLAIPHAKIHPSHITLEFLFAVGQVALFRAFGCLMIVHKCKEGALVSSNSSTRTKTKIAAKDGQIFKQIDTPNTTKPKAITS
jgi:hypothetical protein